MKNYNIFFYSALFLLLFGYKVGLSQQVVIGNDTQYSDDSPITISNTSFAMYSRSAFVYKASELNGVGINGGKINKIAWYRANPSQQLYINNNGILKIYIKSVAYNSFDSISKSWQLLNNSSSLVFSGNNIDFGSTSGWIEFALQNNYDWDGVSNLLIMVEWENADTAMAKIGWRSSIVSNANCYRSGSTLTTLNTLGRNSYRPNVRLSFTNNVIDAELGGLTVEKGKCFGDSAKVMCRIRNNSNSNINSALLNWSINGQLKPNFVFNGILNSSDDTTILLGYVPFTNTSNLIKAWVNTINNIQDQKKSNDTVSLNAMEALSGVYTVGNQANFQTFAEAITALNSRGVCADVTFNFDSASGPYTGVYHIYDYNVTGSHKVVFNGNGTVLNANISGSYVFNQDAFLYIHGAKYLTVDGFNFKFLGNATSSSSIRIEDSSEHVIIRNNKFSHQVQSNGISIEINGSSEATSIGYPVKVNNILIENNFFSNMRVGVEIDGKIGSPLYIIVRNNKFVDFTYNALDINNARNCLISGNEIYSSKSYSLTTAASVNGIMISGEVSGTRIEKNKIHDIQISTNATSQYDVKAIYCYNVSNLIIANNLIYNASNFPGEYYGIYCVHASEVDIEYNTISSGPSSLQTASFIGVFNYYNYPLRIRNNIISYTSMSALTKTLMWFAQSPDSNVICDYNLYYMNGKGSGQTYYFRQSGQAYNSLANWKTNYAGLQDEHSFEGNPVFTNQINSDFKPVGLAGSNRAAPLTGTTVDFDNQPRDSSNPDIGAYEFEVINIDAFLKSVYVSKDDCISPQDIKVIVQNNGVQPIDSIELHWMMNGVVQPIKKYHGTIAHGEEIEITIGTYPMAFAGNYTVKAWIVAVNNEVDLNSANDTTSAMIHYTVFAGKIDVGGPGAQFQTISAALQALQISGICSTVILNVNPEFGPYNEQVVINPIPGLSFQKQLIINGNGSVVSNSVTGSTDAFVFRFNGASYVTLNGFQITPNPANGFAIGIHLKSNSNYNVLSNNKINLVKGSGQIGINFNQSNNSQNLSGLFRGNMIISNEIDGGVNSMRFFGTNTNTQDDKGTIIRKNLITNFSATSLQIYDMDSIQIEENEFHQKGLNPQSIGLCKIVFLNVLTPIHSIRISRNNIHHLVNNNSISKDIRVFDILLEGSSAIGSEVIIENNIITNVSTAGKFSGVTYDNSNGLKVLNNTLKVDTATNAYRFVENLGITSPTRHFYYNNINYLKYSSSVHWYYSQASLSNIKSDNNAYYKSNLGAANFNNFNNTYSSWLSVIKCDSNSKVQVDLKLLPPSTIFPSDSSILLASGKGNLGVLKDFLGASRSVSKPSIGAIENGKAEFDGPTILYSKLQIIDSTKNLLLSNFAYITDASGIDSSFANKPRLYYKKRKDQNIYIDNTKGVDGWKYVTAINNTSPYSFVVDYGLLKDSSVSKGDFIDFFIYAKDKYGNATISNYNFSNELDKLKPIEEILPITTKFDYYGISRDFSDTIYVGNQHPIKSLSKENGLFHLLQYGYVTGDLKVIITSDLEEDGSYTFRKINKKGAIGIVHIEPLNSSTYTLTSVNKKPIIQFDGADTILLGSNNSSSRLIFSKNFTTAVDTSYHIMMNADTVVKEKSNGNIIRNCDFVTQGVVKYSFGVYIGVISNSIFLFDNHFIGNKFGVIINPDLKYNHAPNSLNSLVITGNTFTQDTLVHGIYITKAMGVIINGNKFNVSNEASAKLKNKDFHASAISVDGYANEITISGNRILYKPNGIISSVLYGIRFSDTIGGNRQIINNLFAAEFAGINSANNIHGIYLTSTDSIDVLNNTILFKGRLSNSSSFSNVSLQSCKSIKLVNNSFQNDVNYFGNPCVLIDMYRSTFKDVEIDYNHYQTGSNNNIIKYNDIRYDSIKQIIAISGSNKHSIFGDANSHANTYEPGNMLLFGKALKINSVYRDINNTIRPIKPTIGAFEKDSLSTDIELKEIITPVSCVDTSKSVNGSIRLKNNGIATVLSSHIKVVWGNQTGDTLVLSNNNPIEPNSEYVLTFTIQTNVGKLKNGYLKAINLLNSDQNISNDTTITYFKTISGESIQLLKPVIDTLCRGQIATLDANDPIYRNIEWYDASLGGKLVGVGNTINYNIIKSDSLFMQPNTDDEVDSISTGSLAGIAARGIFLNITNNNTFPIRIHKFDAFMQSTNSSFFYSIYGKPGTYNGFENNSNNWKKITNNNYGSTFVVDNKRKTVLSIDSIVIIMPGQTYAIYIDASSTSADFSTVDNASNSYNHIKDGVVLNFGSVKSFSGFNSAVVSNRKPQVTVYYNKIGKCYITKRVKYNIVVAPEIVTKINPMLNIYSKSGTIVDPDIVCTSNMYGYRLLNPIDRSESEYNVTWKVKYKRFYSVDEDITIYSSFDTSRAFQNSVPGNATNTKLYALRYDVVDLITGCNFSYVRYVVFLKKVDIDLGENKAICNGDSILLKSNVASPYVTYFWSNGSNDNSIVVKHEGNYKLKVVYGNCSYSEDSVFVKVNPALDSLKINMTLKDSCRYEFNTDVLPNAVLHWDFGDGFSATGNTVTHAYQANGIYFVKLSFEDTNSCITQKTSQRKITVICFSGINHLVDDEVQVYPNPSKGIFHLSAKVDIDYMEVYNTEGRLVSKSKTSEIDLTSMPDGIYTIKIISNNGVLVRKLIKHD